MWLKCSEYGHFKNNLLVIFLHTIIIVIKLISSTDHKVSTNFPKPIKIPLNKKEAIK